MDLTKLYGKNTAGKTQRAERLKRAFTAAEGSAPKHMFSSSGRCEVLGNHTDHNHGKVIVAAISCDILACVSPRCDGAVKLCSEGYPPIEIKLNDLSPHQSEQGTSHALVRGIAAKLHEMGYEFGGFTAHTTSDIFKGAGVSSSAAFEVLVCEIFNTLYLGGKLSPVDRAVIGQYAENVYFGKPCGLLDQCGISLGSLTELDFAIPEKPLITRLNPPKGLTFVITNTGGDHAKLTPHYAAIREEMHAVANCFGKQFLRDVPECEFYAQFDKLADKLSGRALLRAMHFYAENNVVDRAAEYLKAGNADGFLECINASGLSSQNRLQNCGVPGDLSQRVILGIEYSRSILNRGAVRVHGGGFAGSILACVDTSEAENYAQSMKNVFGADNVFTADVREPGTCEIEP